MRNFTMHISNQIFFCLTFPLLFDIIYFELQVEIVEKPCFVIARAVFSARGNLFFVGNNFMRLLRGVYPNFYRGSQ